MTIEKRDSGHYRVRVWDSALGKRVAVGTFHSYTAAKAQERKAQVELESGGIIAKKRDTTFGQLCDEFLAASSHLRPGTHAWYATALRPARAFFGDGASVRGMTKADVKTYASNLIKAGKKPKTIHSYVKAVGAVMEHAIDAQLRADNPARGLKNLPANKAARKPDAVTRAEHLRVVAAVRGEFDHKPFDGYRVMLSIWPWVGLRVGEMLGLTWEHVHLDGKYLRVEQQLRADGTLDGKLKTPKSHRVVNLPAHVVRELREWKIACPPNALNLVFPAPRGKGQNRQQTYKLWNEACERAGLFDRTLYVMRHSFASWHLEAGANPKWVAEQMGHEDCSITLQTYTHLLPTEDPVAVSKLEEWYERQDSGQLQPEVPAPILPHAVGDGR